MSFELEKAKGDIMMAKAKETKIEEVKAEAAAEAVEAKAE